MLLVTMCENVRQRVRPGQQVWQPPPHIPQYIGAEYSKKRAVLPEKSLVLNI